MRCKGLFETNDIVLVPVPNGVTVADMMRDVKSFAYYHGMRIKTEVGIYVRSDSMEVEKVLRCEVIERSNTIKERKKQEVRETERDMEIINFYREGISVKALSETYQLSRQGVYNILNKYGVKRED